MEAAGFEPASRNVSKQASTCLVGHLVLALLTAEQQAFSSASSLYFSLYLDERPYRVIPHFDALTKLAGAIPQDGPLIKQPYLIGSCQLILCRMISQANRHPGHATCLSTRPVEAFRPRIGIYCLYMLFSHLAHN